MGPHGATDWRGEHSTGLKCGCIAIIWVHIYRLPFGLLAEIPDVMASAALRGYLSAFDTRQARPISFDVVLTGLHAKYIPIAECIL